QYGFGGMVSFELDGDSESMRRLLKGTKLFTLAESLGGVESLIEHPATMSHASMDAELREEAGINDRIVRLSVGIEETSDLIEDLASALRQCQYNTSATPASARSVFSSINAH
ncbi:MAG TPA: PLP-dependent transferase, partial [bacterium]|nr:PLP-dependent transferase [bacterium]